MSPTMFSIQAALAVLLLAAPAALAEDAAPVAAETTAEATPETADASADEAAAALAEEAAAASAEAPAEVGESAEAPAAPAAPAEAPAEAQLAEEPMEASPEPMAAEATEVDEVESLVVDVTEDVAEMDGEAAPESTQAALDTHPPLGAIGYDSAGRQGRIHIVVRGDTLWDISDAYLGTPWVWPSIWDDNGEIENPHRIYPGDRIWITPSEMRKISAEEAALLLSNLPPEPEAPAAMEDLSLDEPLPAAQDPEPAVIAEPEEYGTIRIANRENAGLITREQMDASASIVGRENERVLLSQEDQVYIGLGEGEVEVGDQLTVIRTHEKVFDPDTGVLLGYHVDFLGWVEVQQTMPETALARIGMSTGGLMEGDRVIPREPLPAEVALKASPDVEGKISFFPQSRVVIGYHDFVYLNRGTFDGLEVGSPLDVYRPGYSAEEVVRDEQVQVPDSVIGRLVVVRAEGESAVAWVMRSRTELALGDRFRGAGL